MHVEMKCLGGGLDGVHKFEEQNVMSQINRTQDQNLKSAMLVYGITKGRVGKAAFTATPTDLATRRDTLAGQKYEVIERHVNAGTNIVEVVAKFVPPKP